MLKKPRRFPNKSIRLKKKVDKYANIIFGSDDPEEKTGEEVDDEELVRAKAKKNKFDSGYDFFDEAPKKSMGLSKAQTSEMPRTLMLSARLKEKQKP